MSSWTLSLSRGFGAALALAVAARAEPASLEVDASGRHLVDERGEPFLWIGCTAWGMTEWLAREEVDLYLDDRMSKGMNVVQLCLFWGKRVDGPLAFQANPPNAYGHRAFEEPDGRPDPTRPATVAGGGPENPNDYWDHVEYCLDAIARRGMRAAILPVWGRRYVNATHEGHSAALFDAAKLEGYGRFLGARFGRFRNIVWVAGGDVKAMEGGDFREAYRRLAAGLEGGAGARLMMSYHPDGAPLTNSSTWFHQDDWLDFNMIETFTHVDRVADAVRADRALGPAKPTILAEGDYESLAEGTAEDAALRVRRQAYQAFFAGAAGFTYGGAFDAEGNGPLFGPSNNWQRLLDWEGARQMRDLRRFLESHGWPHWTPSPDRIADGRGEGALEKLAVATEDCLLVYFPENSPCALRLESAGPAQWIDPRSGAATPARAAPDGFFQPPSGWEDAVLAIGEARAAGGAALRD